MFRRHYWSIALATACLLASASSRAQDLEPRAFNNLPIGLTFIGLGLARSDGDLSPTPSSPLQDAELTIDLGALALSHTFALAGNSSKIDFVAGRTCYEGSATFRGEFVEGRRCEYVDPRIKLTWNFYGAPALSMADFRKWQQGVVAGASILATVPVGTYDSDHLINAGANRWMLRPSLGMSWRRQRWQFEVIGSVSLFEDNDDFYGGIRVEQDPLYAFSTHVIYNFNKGRWLSLDANWFTGGETTKDGTKGGDRQENSRFGVTFSSPLTTQLSLKLYASTGVATRIGNDFDTFGVGAVYRF